MRTTSLRVIYGLTLLIGGLVPLQAQVVPQAKGLEGIWFGTLQTGVIDLRVAFHVSSKDGKLAAHLDSLDQGPAAKNINVDDVQFKDGTARLEIKTAGAVYEGKMNKDSTELTGTFTQAGKSIPLTLKRVDKVPTLARPQEPKRPFPYVEEDVVYENKKADLKLAGTLTLPKGEGPFPAVLLITGSGPQDRNEEILGHKPFLVIADYLTRRGIAVLRVDDRGVGKSTGKFATATTADFAEDVLAGIEFLKSRKEIDARHIGLIGHSEGGIIAPMVATRSKDVAFIVMLAGPGLPGDEILLLQNEMLLKALGAEKPAIDVQLKLLSLVFPVVKDEKDDKAAGKRIREDFAKWKENASEAEKALLAKVSATDLQTLIDQMASPWFRYFLVHDPRVTLRKVQCPVLALIGEKDLQVPCKQNLEEISKALKEGGNKDFTTKEFNNLNHLFQTCKTGATTEYGTIEETLAPVVLETMADWIAARTKKK